MRRLSGYLFATPYLILFSAFLVAPLLYGLAVSLFRWDLLTTRPPTFVAAGNYAEAVADPYFRKALAVTLEFVALATPTTVALALLLAALLESLRRQTLYRAAFFVPTMLTISVAGILWRWFFNTDFGLLNSGLARFGVSVPWLTDTRFAMPSIVLMTLWWTVGGPTVILLAGLQNIPRQFLEAASIDGAGGFTRFRTITLPLLRPVLLFVVAMNVIGAFQVFGQTFIVTRGGPELATRVLVQYIYETAFNNYRMGYSAAMSWLLFAVIALVTAVLLGLLRER
jgi:multiple sugar transport system permease protein